jgi:hypothetical protein
MNKFVTRMRKDKEECMNKELETSTDESSQISRTTERNIKSI